MYQAPSNNQPCNEYTPNNNKTPLTKYLVSVCIKIRILYLRQYHSTHVLHFIQTVFRTFYRKPPIAETSDTHRNNIEIYIHTPKLQSCEHVYGKYIKHAHTAFVRLLLL